MPGKKPSGNGTPGGPSELFDYLVAYAKQETLDPVVRQGKALGRGIAGAFLLAIGTVLLAIGLLRALQGQFGSNAGQATATPASTAPSATAASVATVHSASVPKTASAPSTVTSVSVGASPTVSLTTPGATTTPGTPTTLVQSLSNPYGSGHPLSGDWSWVPYMGGALLCLLVTVFCVVRIARGAAR